MTAIGDHVKTNIYIQCTHLTSLADKKEKCVFEAHLNGCKWCAKVTQSGPIYSSHAFSLTTCKKLKWHTHTLCKHKVDHYCSLWAIEINNNPQGNCSKDMELLKDCSHIFCPDSRLCIFCELKNSYSYLQGVCKSHRPVTWHNRKNPVLWLSASPSSGIKWNA